MSFHFILVLIFACSCFSGTISRSNGVIIGCKILKYNDDFVSYVDSNSVDTLEVASEDLYFIVNETGDKIVYNEPALVESAVEIQANKKSATARFKEYQLQEKDPFVGAILNLFPFIPATNLINQEYGRAAGYFFGQSLGFFIVGFGNSSSGQSGVFLLNLFWAVQVFDGYFSNVRFNNELSRKLNVVPAN